MFDLDLSILPFVISQIVSVLDVAGFAGVTWCVVVDSVPENNVRHLEGDDIFWITYVALPFDMNESSLSSWWPAWSQCVRIAGSEFIVKAVCASWAWVQSRRAHKADCSENSKPGYRAASLVLCAPGGRRKERMARRETEKKNPSSCDRVFS